MMTRGVRGASRLAVAKSSLCSAHTFPVDDKLQENDRRVNWRISCIFDQERDMSTSLLLLTLGGFLFFRCECGGLLRFLVTSLVLGHRGTPCPLRACTATAEADHYNYGHALTGRLYAPVL
jgi:hypothetical protein